MFYRLLSVVLVLTGVGFQWTGLSMVAKASCTPGSATSGQECIPAHGISLDKTLGDMVCEWTGTACQRPTGSDCGTTGYGLALPGSCVTVIGGSSETPYCIENAGTTVVILNFYSSACVNENGSCSCKTTVQTNYPQQFVQVCSCREL